MSLSDKIYYPMGDKGGELRVIWVKDAIKTYILKKAEGFKMFRQGKITLSQLRLRLMEIENEIFGEELLNDNLIKYPSEECPNPLKEQGK